VKAYPEDNKTETSLIHGSIEVTIKNRPNDKIILSPSEKLVVENSSLQSVKDRIAETRKNLPIEILPMVSVNKLEYAQADSSIAEIQWVENKLVFRDRSFVELVSDMERWYNVTISISDQELEGIRLTGIFENETIEQALDALKISTAFVYEKKRNKIIIHR
jgi:hypothetical protein